MTSAGCATEDPPPEAAGSPTTTLSGTVVRLDPAARELIAGDERIPAGIAPTAITGDGVNLAYVTDRRGDAVLVVRLRPQLEITRRVHVPGAPYAIRIDGARLLVRTEQGTVELTADGRPRPLPSRRTAAR